MAGTSTVSIIAESLASAIEPLEVALRSPELFESFMSRLGWTTSTYIESVQNLGGIATNLSQLVREGLGPGDTVPAISQLVKFFDEVRNLSTTTVLPATIDATEFRSVFPQQLTDYLIANYVLRHRPLLGAMLLAGGVITRTQQAAAGKRPAYERLDVAWGAVGDLVHDALSTLRSAYGWGTPAFAQQSFVDNMVTLGEALGCVVFSHSMSAQLKDRLNQGATSTTSLQDCNVRWRIVGTSLSPATVECGIDLFVLPPTATAPAGIAVSPYTKGFGGAAFDITDVLSIDLKAGFDISKGVLVSIRPGRDVTIESDLLSTNPGAAGEFAATLQLRGDAGAKTTLFGSESGSRFEYGSLGLTLGARTDQNGPSFYAEAAIVDGEIVISPGADADGFVAALLPSDITIDAGLTVGVDSRRGAYFGGSAGLEVEIPAHISLGPLEILSAAISVKPKGGALPVALGATFRGTFGPFVAEVDNVGLIVDLSFPGKGGNIGPVNATLKYKPPTGVGLVIEAPAVTGGGFLQFDPAREEYSGILQLEIAEIVAVKAIGLLTTRLTDGAKGFSLVLIIAAEGFAPIQLGFGFTLTGIGGLLGVNRTAMVDVLRNGLKQGTLGSILFPADPIRNAPQIISDLRAVFPPVRGRYIFGPMAQIAWGTPTLLTLEIGLLLELPEPVRLIILGRLQAVLPDPDLALIRIRMDAIGVLDFNKEEVSLDATLYDSRILAFVLTGDMALRVNWGRQPTFVLAIGGFNPRFKAPSGFPQLARLALSLGDSDNPRLRFESYLALTSNTVQFGARFDFAYSAAGFTLAGLLAFDALFQFAPFHFIVDVGAMVALKRGSSVLMGIFLDMTVAGPTPWHFRGTATFKVLFFKVSIRFDHRFGDAPPPALPPAFDLLALVAEALGDRRNWSSALPRGEHAIVSLREPAATPVPLRVHPLAELTVRQRVVPLNLRVTRFGTVPLATPTVFTVAASAGAATTSMPSTPVRDAFALAQFQEMSDDEKLTRPAFEQQDAGLHVAAGDAAYQYDALPDTAIVYETLILDPTRPAETTPAPQPYVLPPAVLDAVVSLGAAGQATIRRTGSSRYRTLELAA
ncbi:MAG TPA: DUF6603 domain-containing protein [Vicinamibacterales bacterium]|nr:DUF6603 domain-containing protein [Vicinamibacterales bacterium]